MSTDRRIWTIGYGARSFEEFTTCLASREIGFLIDVRTVPRSSFKPEFSEENIRPALRRLHVRYVFMGDILGGRPAADACYTDGYVDYAKCREHEQYKRGLDRLRAAAVQPVPVAIMCSEGRPEECHRSKLLGEMAVAAGIEVLHIDERGVTRTHSEVLAALSGGQLDLLGGDRSFKSRKRYRIEGDDEV